MPETKQPQDLQEALKVIQQLTETIQQQNELIKQFQVALKLQQHRRFAKKNESFNLNQLTLFEQVASEVDSETEVEVVLERKVVRHRKPKPVGLRQETLDQLPQTKRECDLDNSQCPDCQQTMVCIGEKLVKREAKLRPAQAYCENTYAKTYKCPHCHPNGGDKLVTAPVASPLFNHSYISSSILSAIATNKFYLALPFNRQERLWKAYQLGITSKQMARAVILGAERYLSELYEILLDYLRKEKVVHMDETPFQVLDSGKTKSYFWSLRTPKEFVQHQIALFYYAPTRSGKVIQEILTPKYCGTVMCDGYRGYGQ